LTIFGGSPMTWYLTNANLGKLPGTTEARRSLVARGLGYLDQLSKDSGGDPGLEREVAAAYVRVGDIQGGRGQADLGDRKGALASYLKARAMLSSAATANPGDLEAILTLIQVNEKLSLSYSALGNQAESQKAVEEAVRGAELAARSRQAIRG
jgi:eukaryotic-like serine/threonine-protein kinase